MQVRHVIQIAVAFLTAQVKQPDEDDWEKLKQMLQYLKGTQYMRLTLCADLLSTIKWWVDASFYAVHPDCCSHMGGGMSLEEGMSITASRNQKISGKSLTISKMIGVNNMLPQILWTRYFLQAQRHKVKENIVHQEKESAILLEINSKGSSSKQTKHIKIRYFFIKDKSNHCPTELMWADPLTKPKQGKTYQEMQRMLMNIDDAYAKRLRRKRKDTKTVSWRTLAAKVGKCNWD